ncbi:hypothetical protein [Pajaroellobacter abortibovis]|uniref:hypothetical protein n=1 Tax=Pajaroellobacter abortibovis TaxID=1882918 RepID=UPI0012EB78C9|nr:hypothetical protein [Pajaroellobacter abortibovis]
MIAFHSRLAEAEGWIRISVGCREEDQGPLLHMDVMNALGFNHRPSLFYVFRGAI